MRSAVIFLAVLVNAKRSWKWQDISNGNRFYAIASHIDTEALWAINKNLHESGKGFQLSYFDKDKDRWVDDPNQPVGSDRNINSLSVDAQGNPAFTAAVNPKHIYYKYDGYWEKFEDCSLGVIFDKQGTMYRLDCKSVF